MNTTSGFYALEAYFDTNFGTLSAQNCESKFIVRRHSPQDQDQLNQMNEFLSEERKQGRVILGEQDISRYTDREMTLVAVDMNDPRSGPLGVITSYITVELLPSANGTNMFLYIGNSHTSTKYQRLGLSVLLRFFFLKMALELHGVLNLEGIGSYTMAAESEILMVKKLGFHKYRSTDKDGYRYEKMRYIAENYGTYVDTFLMLNFPEDIEKLKYSVETQMKLMGSCMLNFQKKRKIECNYCKNTANFKAQGKNEYFCGHACQKAYQGYM